MDSLRYWVEACHVDGFRFDLATTLARGPNGFDRGASFFAAIKQDPVLANVKLIAEPWDIGPGGYQLGGFPAGWSEWNDRFRGTMRRYWAGAGNLIGDVGGRMTGSADVFNHEHRGPSAGINHITVHDGFTLADLTSYAHKHNEANGEDNRDGTDENFSTNCGVEGRTEDAQIVALRQQLRRNLLGSLLLAQGVPLILGGDEVGNSQDGNNNAYCQDNPVGWVDWSNLGHAGEDMTRLIGQLTSLRRAFPQLRARRWVEGRRPDGSFGVLWFTPQATEMTETDWNFPEGRFLSYAIAPLQPNQSPLYIVMNSTAQVIEFTLPRFPEYGHWLAVWNSAAKVEAGEEAAKVEAGEEYAAGSKLPVAPRCIHVFSGSI